MSAKMTTLGWAAWAAVVMAVCTPARFVRAAEVEAIASDDAANGDFDGPKSQVRTDLIVGSNQYSDFSLSGWHMVNSELDLGVNLRSTKIGSTDWVRGLGVSASFRQNQDNTTSVSGDFSNYSTSLRSRAFRASHRYNLASLWKSQRRSDLALGLETAIYEEDRQNTVRQNGLMIGLDQEMDDFWSAGFSGTFFWVPDRDRARVSSLLQSFEASPLVRAAAGLLKQSFTVYVAAVWMDRHKLELSINRADPLDELVDPFLTTSLRWDFLIDESWGVGAMIASTAQQGGQSARTSSAGVSLSYAF
jgi:hypothetical protein